MADSISRVGSPQSIDTIKKPQGQSNKSTGQADKAAPSTQAEDQVDISDAAIERQAAEARTALSQNTGQSLGLDPSFDTAV